MTAKKVDFPVQVRRQVNHLQLSDFLILVFSDDAACDSREKESFTSIFVCTSCFAGSKNFCLVMITSFLLQRVAIERNCREIFGIFQTRTKKTTHQKRRKRARNFIFDFFPINKLIAEKKTITKTHSPSFINSRSYSE